MEEIVSKDPPLTEVPPVGPYILLSRHPNDFVFENSKLQLTAQGTVVTGGKDFVRLPGTGLDTADLLGQCPHRADPQALPAGDTGI